MIKECKVCGKPFDPAQPLTTPAQETGAFLAGEIYDDVGQLCPQCLGSRGELAMMYMREFN